MALFKCAEYSTYYLWVHKNFPQLQLAKYSYTLYELVCEPCVRTRTYVESLSAWLIALLYKIRTIMIALDVRAYWEKITKC